MNITPKQVVATLLEDFANGGRDEYEQRPGGAKDMWRQGGFKKFSFKANKFTGKRPGEKAKANDDDKTDAPEPKAKSRFAWTPPKTESLLHELGGHYCFSCKSPCNVKHDKSTGKGCCDRCGAEVNYRKHGKAPVPKEAPVRNE